MEVEYDVVKTIEMYTKHLSSYMMRGTFNIEYDFYKAQLYAENETMKEIQAKLLESGKE